MTFGSTLANLRGWIEHQGAHVIRATTLGATFGGTKLAQSKDALDKLLNKFPEVEILSRNLGFTPDCFTGRETHFLTQVPSHDKMQALVRASDKVRPLLNPIGEYNQRLEQLQHLRLSDREVNLCHYAATAGLLRKEKSSIHGTQPGDPARAAQCIIRAMQNDSPPFRLVLGRLASERVEVELKEQLQELKEWKQTAAEADFPN